MSIICTILNASGELDEVKDVLQATFDEVVVEVETDLHVDKVDVIFLSASELAMSESGVGGFTPGPNHVYIYIDPKSQFFSKSHVVETLYHEFHHTMRWRDPGYGQTLGEALITEGLACLYEEQKSGKMPVYTQIQLDKNQMQLALDNLHKSDYNHTAWFYGGEGIDRWFGYAYGYKLCKTYAEKHNTTAIALLHTPAQVILGD